MRHNNNDFLSSIIPFIYGSPPKYISWPTTAYDLRVSHTSPTTQVRSTGYLQKGLFMVVNHTRTPFGIVAYLRRKQIEWRSCVRANHRSSNLSEFCRKDLCHPRYTYSVLCVTFTGKATEPKSIWRCGFTRDVYPEPTSKHWCCASQSFDLKK